jgi:hypothetical protein
MPKITEEEEVPRPQIDLLWLYKMDYMLQNSKLLDKFYVVNRIRNSLSDVFDMTTNVRNTIFKVMDFYQELEHFFLEHYNIPSSY